MNEHTYQKLEFDEIRRAVAGACACSLGRHLAETLAPSTRPAVVRQWLAQVAELGAVLDHVGYPPFGGIYDIHEEVNAASFPTPLEADRLARVAETLEGTVRLRSWFARLGDRAPQLASIGERIGDFEKLAALIGESVDPRGHVRDTASSRLASIREMIERTRDNLRSVCDRLVKQGGVRAMLAYQGVTFHEDRMVLPLKSEYHGRIKGIVHRSSESGSTLFVEPAESVELNNTLTRLRDEEQKEITRILRELCRKVASHREPIISTLRAVAVLDLIGGKCRYGRSRRCTCPEVCEDGRLELHEARHPVLLEVFDRQAEEAGEGTPRKQVVPIDVRLGEDFDILMITGPNTGGKTVALKTVGLMALMAQCGIPIPAGEGSRVPVYHQIHCDVGDEQSIQQSLSTFSSHLSNLLDILQHSGPKSLVLIDELGAGTDPDEGAAIGQAVISELLRLGAKAVITTHLSALKAVAFTVPRVDNGSVEFDVESLRPTYRLRLGEPGNSNALIIAERLGMPARLVRFAAKHLDDRNQALNKAIRGTLDSRREAEEARKVARAAALESKRSLESLEAERRRLAEEQATFVRWTKWVNALRPGDAVYLKALRDEARLVRLQLHKQTAVVSTGMIDMEVPLRDISEPQA